jgi:hypothetical protein
MLQFFYLVMYVAQIFLALPKDSFQVPCTDKKNKKGLGAKSFHNFLDL